MTTYTAASGAHASRHGSAGADPVTIAESQVTNLVADLALKAPLASPALTGSPTLNGVPLTTGGGATLVPTAVKTGAYSAVVNDLVPVDSTSGNVPIAAPIAPADKAQFGVKHVIRGGTNTVTINFGGSDVLNKTGGSTSFTLTLANQGVVFQYKASGAIWYVLSDDLSLAQLDARYPLSSTLGGAALLNVGTAAGTVAAGNDSRFAGPLPALEGRTGWAFGHSYATGTGASGGYGWVQRLARRLGFGSTNNGSVGGARMVDAGTYQVSALWHTLTLPTYGVMYLECCYNDASEGIGTTQQRDGFNNGLRSFVNIVRSSIVRDHTHAAWTYTGTWSTVNDTEASHSTFAGSVRQTSTLGDTATVDIQGTELCLLLMGLDDTNYGSTGGAVTVTCDGVTIATGLSLSNRMAKPSSNSRSRVYVPVRITGLNPGYHRIGITKTDTTGSIVQIGGAVSKATNPPYVVLVKDPYTLAVTTNLDYYNGQLDVIAAEFDARVTVASSPAAWVPATHVGVDGIHPNDQGHEVILNNVYAQAGTLPDAVGISVPPFSTVPITLGSDDFNRADNTATLGSTSVGALPWQHVYAGSRWGIASNTAACELSVTDSAVEVETGKADATITATLTAGSANNVGLRFRGTSDGISLVWFNTGGLFTASGVGSIASLGSAPGAYTTGDTVQIVCTGTTVVFKKNGTTLSTQTIANQAGGTRHGLHARADTTARWDNFSVA